MLLKMNRRRMWSLGILIVFLSGCSNNNWKVFESTDYDIYYKAGTYAEAHLEDARRSYDNSMKLAEHVLPRINKRPKVKVYLHEGLKHKGYAKVKEREVHFRYDAEFRLTSVHEFLHIFLYEINPNVPVRFEEGYCRIRERKRKRFAGKDHDILYYQLIKFSDPARWTIHDVFKDDYNSDDDGNIAAAFVVYMITSIGEQKFWDFYEQLDKKNWRELCERYFGKPVAQIDQGFKAFVQTIPDPPEAFKHKYSPQNKHLHK